MNAPRATYRLQFTKDFGFEAAVRIAPYLARIGVSHVYASPYLKARPGSTHGYDIVAHDQLNPELGDEAAFRRMHEAFAAHGLKQILDFVPNHMGVGGADNPLWLDVLEWGPQSSYAGWFDIDWDPDRRYLTDKLLAPVLGGQYGTELENGKLVLRFDADAGDFAVWAYDAHKLPIFPLAYARILGDSDPKLEVLGDEFAGLMQWRPQMHRRAAELKRELAKIVRENAQARVSLEESLARLNGAADNGRRRELDELIQGQYWRATHFRVAGDDINYRRFFNINDLAGLRVELPEVFEHTHQLVFRLLREHILDGLRIDHIDGLLDPKGYLERLRATAFEDTNADRSFYLVVEKILAQEETLPVTWPVAGTTGYEFANLVLGVLVDPAGEAGLSRSYRELTGEQRTFRDIVRDCKIRIMKNEMASELNVLARDAARVARQNARTADFTRNILHRAIRELIACFPVYRTYLNWTGETTDVDRRYLHQALAQARRNERDVDPSVFDFLEALLTGSLVARPRSGFSRQAVLRCAMKVQQYSGPVMAKGLEDTAFYRYHRLIALNEVGGQPDTFGTSLDEFHAANLERARKWPHAMLATSTHDTKRGEDARARLAILSEVPEDWSAHVRSWREMLQAYGPSTARLDRNDEYLLYQLMLGSWPAELCGLGESLSSEVVRSEPFTSYRARVQAAMLKSLREAKVHSTWAAPNEEYERTLSSFIDAAFSCETFLRSFLPFADHIARLGVHNSLIQTVMKLTAPGMPDIYQGAELWDLSLVDPDNRRALDYDRRIHLLQESQEAWRRAPLETVRTRLHEWRDGSVKLLLTSILLGLRRDHEHLFAEGDYQPCIGSQDASQCICGFLRERTPDVLLVVAARFPLGREQNDSWRNARLQVQDEFRGTTWRDVFTQRRFAAGAWLESAALFDPLPVAVLLRE